MTLEEALNFAASLPGGERSKHYGQPAAKVHGHAEVSTGHEPDSSFVLLIDRGDVEMLMATEPDTYWQTPHYAGYSAVLVRYEAADDDRVRTMIGRAADQARAKKPPRRR
ncbi:DNA-binding protein (MmcQ/YjbR family) [Sphingomonas antarctica]|uniref:hypothetical protein n=1 Tax=Sphingomonas antarctica TaxID=2040274 RepID=UPI0039EC7FDF